MSKPFFSVIVPAHNSAEYIQRCLQSIVSQSFTDYELIVVCDACTDNTKLWAHWYADDIGGKVLVTDYGMDGLARNAGIDAAEGKWLLFLDDDDWWIHEYVMEEIHAVAETWGNNIDLIAFDFIWRGRGYYTNHAQKVNIAVWSKAFRREFIGDTRFPGMPFTSDAPFMDAIVKKQARCYAMHKLMYYYNYMRKGSQTEEHARDGGKADE